MAVSWNNGFNPVHGAYLSSNSDLTVGTKATKLFSSNTPSTTAPIGFDFYDSSSSSYQQYKLQPNITYYMWLFNSIGRSDPTSFSIPQCAPPTPPPPTTSCNSGFCLSMKQSGCNGSAPYYLLEWSAYSGLNFSYYLMMRNNAQVGGAITPASQNSQWTNADSSAQHSYYIRVRKNDGGEVHSGTITLLNSCR